MSIISAVTIYPPQHSNILTATEAVSPWLSQCSVFCFGVSSVQFTCLLPPGTTSRTSRGCTSAAHTEMLFSSNSSLCLLQICSCTASPTLVREPRTRAPADHSSQQENSPGALEQPRDQQALAKLSPARVHYATEFWLFFLVRRFYSAPVDHHTTHSTEQGSLTGTEKRLL